MPSGGTFIGRRKYHFISRFKAFSGTAPLQYAVWVRNFARIWGARSLRTRNEYKYELIFGYSTIIFDINDSCNLAKAKVTYHKFQRRYVTMNPYFESLKAHIKANPPNFGDGESVMTMLYECYNEDLWCKGWKLPHLIHHSCGGSFVANDTSGYGKGVKIP